MSNRFETTMTLSKRDNYCAVEMHHKLDGASIGKTVLCSSSITKPDMGTIWHGQHERACEDMAELVLGTITWHQYCDRH